MRVLNIGSSTLTTFTKLIILRPGETLDSLSYRIFAGGKGSINQSRLPALAQSRYTRERSEKDAAWLLMRLKQGGRL